MYTNGGATRVRASVIVENEGRLLAKGGGGYGTGMCGIAAFLRWRGKSLFLRRLYRSYSQ